MTYKKLKDYIISFVENGLSIELAFKAALLDEDQRDKLEADKKFMSTLSDILVGKTSSILINYTQSANNSKKAADKLAYMKTVRPDVFNDKMNVEVTIMKPPSINEEAYVGPKASKSSDKG